MTLDAKLHKKLTEWQPALGRRQLSITDENGWNVSFTLDRRDELSCLLWDLTLTRTQATTATLRSWAEGLAESASTVLEPMSVLEVDEQRQEALVRSITPHPVNDSLLHYELFLTGSKSAVLRRYRAPANKTGKREQVAFALTNEGLGRLINTLTAVE